MNKNKGVIGIGLIIAIVLGVAVVGGGAYYLGKGSNQEVNEIPEVSEINKEVGQEVSKTQEQGTKVVEQTKTVVDNSSANCTPNSVPSIKVISPNGGEFYKLGDKITVKWSSCNLASSVYLRASLERQAPLPDGEFQIPILFGSTKEGQISSSLNDGEQIVTLDSAHNVVPASYKLCISQYLTPPGQNVISDCSNNSFSIGFATGIPDPKDTSTVNWKTYTNTEYGFSFKYPETWSMVGQPSNNINLKGEITGQEVIFNDPSTGSNFQVQYHINNGAELYNYALEQFNSSSGWYAKDAQKIIVSGSNAIRANSVMAISGRGTVINPPLKLTLVDFLDDNKIGGFQIQFKVPLNNYDKEIEKFNKLLTTFKFL